MMPDDNTVHILLVEDDADLSSSLSSYLEGAGFAVTAVDTCLECYAVLSKGHHFQVALVDISLPDQSGFVLAEYLRANTSMKIIILTARERIEDRVRGYAAGAHNYFVKPVDARELQAAIMSLTHEECPSHPDALPTGKAWHLLRQSWQLKTSQGDAIKLTSLELQFLEQLAVSGHEVVSRDSLLTSLYKRNDEHSGRALDSLVRRLRGKIRANGDYSPIQTAHSVGYCFSEPLLID